MANLSTPTIKIERRAEPGVFSPAPIIQTYNKLVVPVSMRSIYWQYFGFPADDDGDIISRARIVCILCRTQIAYNKNTSNLRMHLQNKHNPELLKLEATAGTRSPKPTFVRAQSDGEEYYFEGNSDELFTIAPSASNAYYAAADGVKKHGRGESSVSPDSNITAHITDFVALDMVMPDIIDGRGFQRLIVNLQSPCNVPSKDMLTFDSVPKIYNQVRESMLEELSIMTCEVGLTIEEWMCANNRSHLTICLYHPGKKNEIECKVLKTVTFLPSMDATEWQMIIGSIAHEWNLTADRVTAVVCACDREPILNAFSNCGYFLLPCLDFTIRECVTQCLDNEVIRDIINKIRDQITILKSHPVSSDALKENCEAGSELILDVEAVWLSTLAMLEGALQNKEITKKLISLIAESATSEVIAINEEEWEVISDLVGVLQPLKMTLLSLSEEKVPFISLVRPMLWQVINNKLNIDESDSDTTQSLKKAIVDLLKYRYNDERIASMLGISTILDPRFKIMQQNEEEVKSDTSFYEIVKMMLGIAIETLPNPDEEVSRKKTNMQLLLGSRPKKMKTDDENTAKVELQQYLSLPTCPLNTCPIDWWSRQKQKFLRVGVISEKYLCVPAVATLPGKRTMESMLSFHAKRSSLPNELLDQLLFLHVNYDVP